MSIPKIREDDHDADPYFRGAQNDHPMSTRYTLTVALVPLATLSFGQLSILTQFDPSNTGGACGIAYNAPAGEIMVIGCNAGTIDRYAEDGTYLSSASMVGGNANDVDIDMSPSDLVMNGTFVAQGQLLLVNGESGVAEIYAIDEVTNAVLDTLVAGFGDSHVVGGSYHPQRGTFFLVQDNVPGGFVENRIAEIDATTGDTIHTFSVQPYFDVNYGDLDISPISGNLFVVSSSDAGVAEFTPDGVFVQIHALPVGVTSLSGIALDNDLQGAWVCSTTGEVFKLGNFPVGVGEHTAVPPTLTVMPNPADDQVTIMLNRAFQGAVELRIIDAMGRVVRQEQPRLLSTGTGMSVNVGELQNGCYTVIASGPEGRATARLVLRH